VKVTLIGRPGDIVRYQHTVVTTVTYTPRTLMLPKGIPAPPEEAVHCVLYIAAKHWRKIEESLQKPDDKLIAEGYAVWDDRLRRMAVFVQNCTSVLTERAKRQAEQDAADAPPMESPPVPSTERQSAPRYTPPPPRPTAPPRPTEPARKARQIFAMPEVVESPLEALHDDPRFAGLPAAVSEQAQGFQLAINQFRAKLEQLEQKPPEQRFGYDMTKKMLENAERQLNAILAKYKK
jgi:hypothetical protein